jgi:hypothetical protein
MDLSIKNYRASLMEKIENSRTSNPKKYWRKINQKTNPQNLKININEFYEYSKKVTPCNTLQDNDTDLDLDTHGLNHCRNGNNFDDHITGDKIKTAITYLK